jgi:hypothetical protein
MRALIPIILILSACAASKPLPSARFSLDLPDNESERYKELNLVRVVNPEQFPYDEENCRKQLRYLAAQEGADLVVLDTKERKSCFLDRDQHCLEMTGRTFQRKE